MEPITHFLTGACLGRAGLNRKTALATATLTLAAEAPDIDVLGSFKDPVFGFAHHRGFTHSFLGLVLVSTSVVALVYFIWRLRGRRIKDPNLPPRWGLLFLYAYFAGLTHILLDFTNNYGVRPFWPFSEKWYSWDIVFIIEPALLLLLTAGLVLPALFGLVSKDGRKGRQARWGAILALFGVIAVWGLRDHEHRRALSALEARTYQGGDPVRASAYPHWWNPFQWYGVVEMTNFFATTRINSSLPQIDPEGGMKIVPKPEESPVTLAAKQSYLGRAYLDWAQYPVTETEQVDSPEPGYVVHFKDLRYDYPLRTGRGVLGASVGLDSNLNVASESIGSRTRRP